MWYWFHFFPGLHYIFTCNANLGLSCLSRNYIFPDGMKEIFIFLLLNSHYDVGEMKTHKWGQISWILHYCPAVTKLASGSDIGSFEDIIRFLRTDSTLFILKWQIKNKNNSVLIHSNRWDNRMLIKLMLRLWQHESSNWNDQLRQHELVLYGMAVLVYVMMRVRVWHWPYSLLLATLSNMISSIRVV